MLRSNHLSGRTLWTCLVLGGWAQQPLKKWQFFENCWRCTTLEDHISGSTWSIQAKVCLLERLNSLLFIENMKIGIYRFLPILERWQYSVDCIDCIFRGTSDPTGSLWGLKPLTIELYKTSIKSLYTFRVFAKKNFLDYEPCKIIILLDFCKLSRFLLIQRGLNMILIWRLVENVTERERPKITFYSLFATSFLWQNHGNCFYNL